MKRDIFLFFVFDWLAQKHRHQSWIQFEKERVGDEISEFYHLCGDPVREGPVMRQIRNINVVVVSHVTPTSLTCISYEREFPEEIDIQ